MFIQKISEYIEQNELIRSGDRVLAAVSGGADSICLFLVLKVLSESMDFQLQVIHVEHGIRGAESRRDAAFVERLCRAWQTECRICSVDVPAYAGEQHMGLEEAARELRYRAFRGMAEELERVGWEGKEPECRMAEELERAGQAGKEPECRTFPEEPERAEQAGKEPECQTSPEEPERAGQAGKEPECRTASVRIALAHHMDDNAETVLFRMCRGSGISGLTGMRPVRKEGRLMYIRPLLCVSRQEIEGWLADRGQGFCTDSSNADVSFARNRMRHRILSELSIINQRAVAHISESAARLAEIQDYLDQQTDEAIARLVIEREVSGEQHGGTNARRLLSMDVSGLLELHPALQGPVVLKALQAVAGRKKDLAASHVQEILSLCRGQSGRRGHLPYGIRAKRVFGRLELEQLAGSRADGTECVAGKSMDEKERAAGSWTGSHERVAGNWECAAGSRTGSQELSPQFGEWEISYERLEELRRTGEKLTVPLSADCELTLEIRDFDNNFQKISKKIYTKCLDYDMINDRLVVRHRLPGDRITIRGGHRKKLKALLMEEKIPADERDQLWILADGQQILWVIGSRIGENYKVSENTKHMMVVEYRGKADGFWQET